MKNLRRYKPRPIPEWMEYALSAAALFFIVWLFFVIGPLIMEGLAR